MPFGFADTEEVLKKRSVARPLKFLSTKNIKTGLPVQSILTDVFGEITSIDYPFITITWNNGNVSRYKQIDMENVNVLDC